MATLVRYNVAPGTVTANWRETLAYNFVSQNGGTLLVLTNLDGTQTQVGGTGFTFDGSNNPTGGTVTGLTRTSADGSTIIEEVTGASVSLTSFLQHIWLQLGGVLSGADQLTGSAASDNLYGDTGDDVLDGGGGDDHLYGSYGNDTYIVDSSDDRIHEIYNRGIDTVRSYAQAYALDYDVENLTGMLSSGQTLIGNNLSNTIRGGAGNDLLNGWEGADVMIGGAGNDTYSVDTWDDIIVEVAGEGIDTVVVARGSYTLPTHVENAEAQFSGSGQTITGNAGNNRLTGSLGADVLVLGDGDDVAYGLLGNDYIYGGSGNDQASGGPGVDVLLGGAGSDILYGDANDDYLHGEADRDYLIGGDGNDILYGGDGIDVLIGEDGADWLLGEAGGDYLYGGNGNNVYFGGEGNDIIVGGRGHETAFGDAGQDYFYMGDGNDVMYGGAGVDVLLGEGGNDTFDAGSGVDYLFLGSGNDTIIINGGSGVQVVNEFTPGGGDVVSFVGTDLKDFATLKANTYDYGSFSIIQVDADTAIWLIGVTPSQFTGAEFYFI
jgi:Ca2+-binding RTX toxin-like protein